jgi:hypothetical protein
MPRGRARQIRRVQFSRCAPFHDSPRRFARTFTDGTRRGDRRRASSSRSMAAERESVPAARSVAASIARSRFVLIFRMFMPASVATGRARCCRKTIVGRDLRAAHRQLASSLFYAGRSPDASSDADMAAMM